MYEVTVSETISASHHLRGYRGKCENVHGHNYRVEATARADGLDTTGLSLDFGVLRGHLREVAARFDHRDLNACDEFAGCNPSSENLARAFYELLAARLAGLPVRLHEVRVWETEGSSVAYRPGPADDQAD